MATPDASSLAEALRHLARLLSDWGRRAAIIGGIGIVARVRPRHTDDVGVVVVVPEGRGKEFLALAHSHGWADDPAETRALLAGGLLRIFRGAPTELASVDVIFVDSTFLEDIVGRATQLDLGVATLPVATTEDLLLLKLDANRPEDLDDILAIKDAFADTLDMTYVRAQAARIGVLELLDLYFNAGSTTG